MPTKQNYFSTKKKGLLKNNVFLFILSCVEMKSAYKNLRQIA